jgi:hypothetical protein
MKNTVPEIGDAEPASRNRARLGPVAARSARRALARREATHDDAVRRASR